MNFRTDYWECYEGQEKKFGSSSLLASKMANETLTEKLRFTFTASGKR